MNKENRIDINKIATIILNSINKYYSCEQSSDKNYFNVVLNSSVVYRFYITEIKKILKEKNTAYNKHASMEKIELFMIMVLKNQLLKDESDIIVLRTPETDGSSFKLKAQKESRDKTITFMDEEYSIRKHKMTISDKICKYIVESREPLSQSDITIKFKNKTTSEQRERVLSILEIEKKIVSRYDRTKGRMKKMFYAMKDDENNE